MDQSVHTALGMAARKTITGHTSLKWLGTVAGIAGALLVALNVGGTIVGIGFVFFAVSATAWVVAGWRMGEPSLVAMHGVFLVINLLGIWRWLVD